jgi:hypothetical protein
MQVAVSLASAVIGGIISPQISQAKERREARAAVRERVAEVDALRWADKDIWQFRHAIAAFESSTILARVPRDIARRFVETAEQAYRMSEPVAEGPKGEPDVLISDKYENPFQVAIADLSRVLWHPWAARVLIGFRQVRTSKDGESTDSV